MNAEAKDVENTLRELSGGKIFSVKFRKRTDPNTIRHMTCRFNVSKGIKGGKKLFEPNDRGLITVWDTEAPNPKRNTKGNYRFVNVEGITEIRVAGESYTFEEMSK